ncbi:MAG: oligosaccharide flippase family protein, partial [Sphingobium sp.]
GAGQLGLYDWSYKLLLFPLTQITWPAARIMTPILSRLAAKPEEYRGAFTTAIYLINMAVIPGVLILISLIDIVIPVILGEKWAGVVPIFQALGFVGLVQPINSSSGWLLITQGRTKLYASIGLITAITNVTAFAIGLPHGAVGVATAYAVVELVRTPLLWYAVGRQGPVRGRWVTRVMVPQVIGGIVTALVLLISRIILPNLLWIIVPCAVVIAYATHILITSLFPVSRNSLMAITRTLPFRFRQTPSAAR